MNKCTGGEKLTADGCVKCEPGSYVPQWCNATGVMPPPSEDCVQWPKSRSGATSYWRTDCTRCQDNKIQWKYGSASCQSCPKQGVDCSIQNTVSVMPGYWLPDENVDIEVNTTTITNTMNTTNIANITNSTNISRRAYHGEYSCYKPWRCPMPDACGGGAIPGDASCKEGYTGPLCGLCSKNKYRGSSRCYDCPPPEKGANTLVLVLSTLVVSYSIFFCMSVRATRQLLEHLWLRLQCCAGKTAEDDSKQSDDPSVGKAVEISSKDDARAPLASYSHTGFAKRLGLNMGASTRWLSSCFKWMHNTYTSFAKHLEVCAVALKRWLSSSLQWVYNVWATVHVDWLTLNTMLKIAVSYIQVLSAFRRFTAVRFPQAFVKMLDALTGWLDVDISVLPWECPGSLSQNGWGYGDRLWLLFTLPLVIMAICCVISVILLMLAHTTCLGPAESRDEGLPRSKLPEARKNMRSEAQEEQEEQEKQCWDKVCDRCRHIWQPESTRVITWTMCLVYLLLLPMLSREFLNHFSCITSPRGDELIVCSDEVVELLRVYPAM